MRIEAPRSFPAVFSLTPLVVTFALFVGWPSPGHSSQTLAQVGKLEPAGAIAFGEAAAIEHRILVIGAPDGDTAYVFRRREGKWVQVASLAASDSGISDFFGGGVAISGDTLVLGATDNDAAGNQAGAAYVFAREGGTWIEQQQLTASDATPFDNFGRHVAVSGNTIMISTTESRAVYVFERLGTTWEERQKITHSNTARLFGSAISMDGNTAVIGAHGAAVTSDAAYVFVREGNEWVEQAELIGSDVVLNDRFGFSVALDDDTAVVGAYRHAGGGFERGSAYVFTRNDGKWREQAKLTASDPGDEDAFGDAVTIRGNVIAVGARGKDGAGFDSGAAYVFERRGTAWSELAKLESNELAPQVHFGDSVAIGGSQIVVGAASGGTAYIFSKKKRVNLVPIDIKPFASPDEPNRIRLPGTRDGFAKVAILSAQLAQGDSVDFDALQVDIDSVGFGPESAPAKRNWHRIRDVDGDGDLDLILKFKVRRTGIGCEHVKVTLTGSTYSGDLFKGVDSIEPFVCR